MKNFVLLSFLYSTILFNLNTAKSQSTVRHITDYKFTAGCSETLYKREFLSDSIFIEKYFYQFNKTSLDSEFVLLDTFKVVNGTWWYRLNGIYYPFFSDKMFRENEITRRNYNQVPKSNKFKDCIGYLPYKTEKVGGRKIYVFKVNFDGCKKENFDKIDIAYLYFDPDIGFIKKKFWTCGMSEMVILN